MNRLFEWVAQRLFGKWIAQAKTEVERSRADAQNYFDVSKENITALVSNSLAILTFGDSSLHVDLNGADTKRTEYLNDIAQKEFRRAKSNISAALGVGMIASIPYSVGGKIYINTITKDRFFITGVQGDEITQITALADTVEISTQKFLRWTNYALEGNGVYSIRNKATNEHGEEIPLSRVEQWSEIAPEIRIGGVERLPVAFYRCPSGGRRPDFISGVPITFGCGTTLKKIETTLTDVEKEFKRKKVRIIADRTLLQPKYDENGDVIENDLQDDVFTAIGDRDDPKLDIFDPAFRETAYFEKLDRHFALLEKEIGCSRGILTDMSTQGATATEIRRAMNATFCLTDDMRKNYMEYFDTLMYAVNVLCNYHNIAPASEYEIHYDWGYTLLEDNNETFRQLLEGKANGAVSKVEIRQFLRPDETPEEAEAAVQKIQSDSPSVKDLMGE